MILYFKMDTYQFLIIYVAKKKAKVKITGDITWIPPRLSASGKSILFAKCKISRTGVHLF